MNEIVPKTEIEKRLEAEGSIRLGKDYQATDIPGILPELHRPQHAA